MKIEPGVVDGVDLEDLFNRLRHICEQLEGNQTLEDAITLHAQGVELGLKIKAELGRAERRMVTVMNQDGSVEPFDHASGPQRTPGR